MKTVADGTVQVGSEVFYFPLNITDYSNIVKKTKVARIEKWNKEGWIITEDNQSVGSKSLFTRQDRQFYKQKIEMIAWHLERLNGKKTTSVREIG